MILVVGDVMIDTYYEGVVNRISPEAPVPVLLIANERHHLGGAGNVARNLRTLETSAKLFGVIGNDDAGKKISEELSHCGIDNTMIVDRNRWSTRKTRFEAHGQQILRVDDECTTDIDDEATEMLLGMVRASLDKTTAVIMSDYAKGVLTQHVCQTIITECKQRGIPVIVDPKQKNLARYTGATILKPNVHELAAATGMPCETKEECLAAGFFVRETFDIASVIITRGHYGMLACTHNGFYEEPGHVREIANVVGAGDTALAAIAFGVTKDWETKKVLEFANMAAALVVSKHGTSYVTVREVLDAFKRA